MNVNLCPVWQSVDFHMNQNAISSTIYQSFKFRSLLTFSLNNGYLILTFQCYSLISIIKLYGALSVGFVLTERSIRQNSFQLTFVQMTSNLIEEHLISASYEKESIQTISYGEHEELCESAVPVNQSFEAKNLPICWLPRQVVWCSARKQYLSNMPESCDILMFFYFMWER